MSNPRIGFIGIGIMGTAMVGRLLHRGFPVTVWNREPEALPAVVSEGAVAAASPAAVAEASDIVLLCVLDTKAVREVVFGPQGVAGAATGRLLVDHSTAEPDATREMAAELLQRSGAGWVDAPVSGGPQAARDGLLTIMAGGEGADIARAEPVMRALGAHVTHIGPVGAGQAAKMINQAIVGTGYVLMAEALALAEASGLDAAALPACLAGGHADGSLLQRIFPQMQRRAFDPPSGYARQLLKDLEAVHAAAGRLGTELPVVDAARQRYRRYVEDGNGMRDSASILRLYRPDAG
ncbi:NAD(P)-dependent oxidoreductase [Roseomonas marmotae]|uniref:NAD(P)-dependent oxidoreductase n=1 Tax=Roseomonas marmotae TaxID=2768161 RepID=A0ABS3KA23_9PROT|nr:NAD(P)-dependent oxidoreductase [Roseomonas marmotae]MBO1073488.1 NAD(P)-dependent oxidoreductase [Roseomonas marmotae]QTI80321.1 NAD(P)-dependent oxidoreductase [Roseomonas marmotae]